MKQLSKSFHEESTPDSPHFPNYLQATTQASLTKSSKSVPKRNKQQLGRSFIYKQENINGPNEFSGRKKLLAKNDSIGSLLTLMEKSDPYLIKTKRKASPPHSKENSYRIYMPELNCETPKFLGVRTYYKDFFNVDPICNRIQGRNPKKEERPVIIQKKLDEQNKENTIPCLPKGQIEKFAGKKCFKKVDSQLDLNDRAMRNLIKGNFNKSPQPQENTPKDQELVWKKPLKKQYSKIFAGSNIFDREEPIKAQNSPLKPVNDQNLHQKSITILPDGPEKTFRKNNLKYPNQKRIMEGDSAFWKNCKNREDSSFVKNDSKVNNLKYKEYVDWMKKEKESFEKYIRNESLDNSQGSIYKEKERRKKQFPQSPIFRTNIQLG